MIKINVDTAYKSINTKHKDYVLNNTSIVDTIKNQNTFKAYLDYSQSEFETLVSDVLNHYWSCKKQTRNKVFPLLKSCIENMLNIVVNNESGIALAIITPEVVKMSITDEIERVRLLIQRECNALKNDEKNIFTAFPSYHQNFLNEFERDYSVINGVVSLEVYASSRKNIRKQVKLKDKLLELFGYKEFSSKELKINDEYCDIHKYLKENPDEWSAYHYVFELGLKVCPYCNRSYITPFYSKKNGKARGELDHFYSKARYPMLSLSIWNLVPSCSICNGSFKSTKEFNMVEYLHPFHEGLNDTILFNIEYSKHAPNKVSSDDIRIKLSDNLPTKAEKSLEVFRVKEMYQYHRNTAARICNITRTCNPNYLKSLQELGVFKTSEEALKFIVGVELEDKECDSIILSKLVKDIYKNEVERFLKYSAVKSI